MHSSATRLRPTGSRVDDSFLARSFQLHLRRPELLALAARSPSLAGLTSSKAAARIWTSVIRAPGPSPTAS